MTTNIGIGDKVFKVTADKEFLEAIASYANAASKYYRDHNMSIAADEAKEYSISISENLDM